MNICVYGASSENLEQIYYEEAFRLGKYLGERGHDLVFGGGNTGLMGAVARGFKEFDRQILGIAPRFFDKPGVIYKECTDFIFTDTMRVRKEYLEDKSEATIVLPGGIGTYEEFFEIYTLKSLGRIDRPIVLYNINGYYNSMKALLEHTARSNFMSSDKLDMYTVASNPEETLHYIENY